MTLRLMRKIHFVFPMALCVLLAACGNKGPLVVPDQKPQTQPAQPATPPAPARDSGKQ